MTAADGLALARRAILAIMAGRDFEAAVSGDTSFTASEVEAARAIRADGLGAEDALRRLGVRNLAVLRYNYRDGRDGMLFCRGDHGRSAGCDWERLDSSIALSFGGWLIG